jgi:hypothetical protein
MKRSTMIKKALNHNLNTVCVNEEQVERVLEVFEKLGMLPPQKKGEFCYECGEAKNNLKWSKEKNDLP